MVLWLSSLLHGCIWDSHYRPEPAKIWWSIRCPYNSFFSRIIVCLLGRIPRHCTAVSHFQLCFIWWSIRCPYNSFSSRIIVYLLGRMPLLCTAVSHFQLYYLFKGKAYVPKMMLIKVSFILHFVHPKLPKLLRFLHCNILFYRCSIYLTSWSFKHLERFSLKVS